ncbi:uncharacterized protein N0V89_008599 [Didymosphaeria variabile]|uniref:Microbial-type PARG catalytic domain-containing protein n=1 Tax=Didymosphaeria variabile TaxID=1932322 RepID=A0A9W8XGR0_9PLEO|nr:uncharacterized protein N0V89_008599 [Didymosphaeria variabile]KAJ4349978.1 hypothetical protein N0V89_008599 [Didymosphaeria variabile]
MLDLATRRKICEETVSRSVSIAKETPGVSLRSVFIPSQLPPLDKEHPSFPALTLKPVEIHNSDAFELARTLGPSKGKVGVLNLASNAEPGGGWRYTLSKTQEEALCYSSTLYLTLRPEWYPWSNTGPDSIAGIFSPDIVVFRDTIDNELVELPTAGRHIVSIMTVAAPCLPRLTEDSAQFANASDLENLREKILLTLRMAAKNGVTSLVLGAMGCGAYNCPPQVVAQEMKNAIEMDEFKGWFEEVPFAVFAAGPSGMRNYDVFKKVFQRA